MSIPEQVARLVEEAILPLGIEHFGFCPLEALSGQAAPAPLKALEGKPVRFDSAIPREGIRDQVLRALGL